MFAFLEWNKLTWPQYLALGGGAVLVLALLLYLLGARVREGLRVPGIVVGIVGGLAVGVAAGILGMARFGYEVKKPEVGGGEDPRNNPLVQRGRGGMQGGMAGGRPTAKQQLAGLIRKLDVLTDKPLTVSLSAEQKKQVLQQLQGLAKPEELKDDEAGKRLRELLEGLKPHKATLEAAGYRWPREGAGGERGGRPQPPPANPFKTKENGDALKALEQRLKNGAEN